MKVLVVDDSATMRKIVTRNLAKASLGPIEVIEASDGVEALEKLGTETVSLILSDVNMPRMNGAELLDKLRAQDSLAKIPVVLITTEATPDALKDFTARGAKGVVAKPFTPEQLEAVVRPLMGG